MLNYSGILYRIWAVCGSLLIIGLLLVLLEKPWAKTFNIRNCKLGLLMIIMRLLLGGIYASRIAVPHVVSYTGEFVETHRNSRVAPPLPFTYEYVFWNGEGDRCVVYLDTFSKEHICPEGFQVGEMYEVFFDEFTNVIVRVDGS